VTVQSTSADAYSITAASGVTLTGGSACQLPIGTTIATVTGQGASYSGQHGLWNPSDCSFAYSTTLALTLNGNTVVEHLGNGDSVNMTRLASVTPAKHSRTLWPWIVLFLLVSSAIAYLLIHRRRRSVERVGILPPPP
jgi:hypothetical protein